MSNVNAQFERSGRHQDFKFAILELTFGIQAKFARQAAMVSTHHVFTHSLGQIERNTLGQAARVYKNQGGAVLLDQLTNAVINLIPQFVAGNGPKFLTWNFDCEIHLALMADVHHYRIWVMVAGKKVGHGFDWLLRGRESDAHGTLNRQRIQALKGESQVGAAFVVGHSMDFVHDDGVYVSKNAAALLSSEQNVERFRRGHQDMGRPLQHPLTFMHERVAGPDGCPNLRHQQTFFAGQSSDLPQRPFQIFLDIIPQGFQWRYVENLRTVSKLAA